MSCQRLEVNLENGRIRPREAELLPAKARALLTIMEPVLDQPSDSNRTLGDPLRELNVQGDGTYTDLSTHKAHLDDLGR